MTENKTTAEDLKKKFQAGSVPLASDFSDLIDIAESARRAVGAAPDQTAAGKGLKYKDGLLEPDVEDFDFTTQQGGCSPLMFDKGSKKLVVDLDDGLVNSGGGVKVKAGQGITVDGNGVSISNDFITTLLPTGMIVMWSGALNSIPRGWALCNGKSGTPDLRDKFIMGAGGNYNPAETGGASSRTTSSSSVSGSVNVSGTSLTAEQLPAHKHTYTYPVGIKVNATKGNASWQGGKGDGKGQSFLNPQIFTATVSKWPSDDTSTIGSGHSHTHYASFSGGYHSHSVDTLPPYYALAFIMKV